MLEEELFEGWLSVSSIGAFLSDTPSGSSPELEDCSVGSSPTESDIVPKVGSWPPASGTSQSLPTSAERPEYHTKAWTRPTPDLPPQRLSRPAQRCQETQSAPSAMRKRQGHTKSRMGCINCKRRKVKCQETWPTCGNCIRKGLVCHYNSPPKQLVQDGMVASAIKGPRLVDGPKLYTGNDFRLFHHFLIAGYPTMPPIYEAVWVRDVPGLAHRYDYLMHSMLALAGSHLGLFGEDPSTNGALGHRQIAIKSLEQAFSTWPPSPEEAHCMLAASYILASQAGYFQDGFLDQVLSLRGCAMLTNLILEAGFQGMFTLNPVIMALGKETMMKAYVSPDPSLIDEALQSLNKFKHHVDSGQASEMEKVFFERLVNTLYTDAASETLLETPPDTPLPSTDEKWPVMLTWEDNPVFPTRFGSDSAETPMSISLFTQTIKSSGASDVLKPASTPGLPLLDQVKGDRAQRFNALLKCVRMLVTWPRDDVLHLLSPTNRLGCVLMSHFSVIRLLCAPAPGPKEAMQIPVAGLLTRNETFMQAMQDDEEWMKYMEWPAKLMKTIRYCVDQKPRLTLGDLVEVYGRDPNAFREGREPSVHVDGATPQRD